MFPSHDRAGGISRLSESELLLDLYSDVSVKFKILHFMDQAGIKVKHGTHPSGKVQWDKAKVEFMKRETIPLNMPNFKKKENILFHYEDFDRLVEDNFIVPSYASYMLYLLSR